MSHTWHPVDDDPDSKHRCAGGDARSMLMVHQAKGAGYAISEPEELETALQVALQTGNALFSPRKGIKSPV